MDEPADRTSKPLPLVIALGAILFGALLWFVVANHPARPARFWIGAAICVLPFVVPWFRSSIERAAALVDRAPTWLLPLAVLGLAWAALYADASYNGRSLSPGWHDEFSYLFQAQTFASGRLWLPGLPAEIRDAFDTFYILVEPKYASQYFPGTAIALLPGVLIGAPAWVTSITLCSAATSLAFALGRTLSRSPLIGLVVATCVLLAFPTRLVSIVAISQPPLMVLTMLAYVAYLATHTSNRKRWLGLLGTTTGWLLVTRPIDAIGLLAPVWVAVIWNLVAVARERSTVGTEPSLEDANRSTEHPHRLGGSLAVPLCAAALPSRIAALVLPVLPFVVLQLVINLGVTGSVLKTPFEAYSQRDMKGAEWSLLRDATWGDPESIVPQKRVFYEGWREMSFASREARVADLAAEAKYTARRLFPDSAALVLVPLGAIALLMSRSLRSAALPIALGVPTWVVLYVGYPSMLNHYYAAIVPALALMTGVGIVAVRERFGVGPARAASAWLLLWSVMSLPMFDRSTIELFPKAPVAQGFARVEQLITDPRAIVLILPSPRLGSEGDEPVFNWRAARLEDNAIVRAHDLGEASRDAVIAYFATQQPDRVVYLYDRDSGAVTRQGSCAELVRKRESSGS